MHRRWKIALWVGGAAVLIPAIALAPPTGELAINLTCRMNPSTPTCIARMRAMGHVWARFGWLDRAITWYGRAAREGDDTAAYFHLGWAYEQRGYRTVVSRAQAHEPNLREDFELAAGAYRKAAERGFAPAMNNLGQMYVSGTFGSGRPKEGAALIIRAAEAGNPLGAVNAALIYKGGMGVPRNDREATRWGKWNGEGVNPRDLAYPVLEHSRMALSGDVEPRLLIAIREASKRRIPLDISFEPLRRDPRLPTFQSVTERFNNRPD